MAKKHKRKSQGYEKMMGNPIDPGTMPVSSVPDATNQQWGDQLSPNPM